MDIPVSQTRRTRYFGVFSHTTGDACVRGKILTMEHAVNERNTRKTPSRRGESKYPSMPSYIVEDRGGEERV